MAGDGAKLFLKSSELGLPHTFTRWREAAGRVPIPTRDIHCGTLYIYVLCGFAVPACDGQSETDNFLSTTLVNATTTTPAWNLYLLGISEFFLYSNILYCLQQFSL
jgi:hypothetical protein